MKSADLALIGVTAIWGCTFLLVQNALSDVSPILFLGIRFAIASVALFLAYRKRLAPAALWPGIATGFFLFAGYAFQTVGLKYTTAAKTAFLTSLSVPLVPLAAALVYRAVPKRFEVIGIVVASIGMVLMTAPADLRGGWVHLSKGDYLSFCCAVMFAGQVVAVSHASGRGNFETLALVQMLTTSLLSFASFAFLEVPVFRSTASLWIAVFLTGLLASALAFSVQAWAQQFMSTTRAAIVYALEPVFAWMTSWFFLGEGLGFRESVGAVLILAGILVVELKRSPIPEHPNV